LRWWNPFRAGFAGVHDVEIAIAPEQIALRSEFRDHPRAIVKRSSPAGSVAIKSRITLCQKQVSVSWYPLSSVEFLREHDGSNPLGGPFVLERWISLVVAVCGAWLLSRRAGPVAAAASA
jgi:hypothetical protein